MKNILIVSFYILVGIQGVYGQDIHYSQPIQSEDYRTTETEIVGAIGTHIIIYKNERNGQFLTVYGQDMKTISNIPLTLLPDRTISVDFVSLSDHFVMVYQFQHNNFVYCYGVMMDQDAKEMADPVLIDSSEVGNGSVKSRIYSVVHSDNKEYVLIYKINQDRNYDNIIYTYLYHPDLTFIHAGRVVLPMQDRRNILTGFTLSNTAQFIFGKVDRLGNSDFVNAAYLLVKPVDDDSLMQYRIPLQGKLLDGLNIALDNYNQQVYLGAFYYTQKHGNSEGVFSDILDVATASIEDAKFIPFSENLRMEARNESSDNGAFNNYFIRQIIPTSGGGFILTAENYYTSSRYQPWNRWDYLGGPWGMGSPYYSYYSPFSPWYYSPYYWNDNRGTRYHYNDIAILCYSSSGKLTWSNFIRKDQFDDDNAAFLSYKMVNVGDALHFIYNDPFRRSFLLSDVRLDPHGQLSKSPTLRALDRGYEWMPRYGKQVGPRSVVIPCIYRNFVCFAKLDL